MIEETRDEFREKAESIGEESSDPPAPATLLNVLTACAVENRSTGGIYGDALVSTGVSKQGKRAAVCPVCVKKDTLKINAKTNNNFALAA